MPIAQEELDAILTGAAPVEGPPSPGAGGRPKPTQDEVDAIIGETPQPRGVLTSTVDVTRPHAPPAQAFQETPGERAAPPPTEGPRGRALGGLATTLKKIPQTLHELLYERPVPITESQRAAILETQPLATFGILLREEDVPREAPGPLRELAGAAQFGLARAFPPAGRIVKGFSRSEKAARVVAERERILQEMLKRPERQLEPPGGMPEPTRPPAPPPPQVGHPVPVPTLEGILAGEPALTAPPTPPTGRLQPAEAIPTSGVAPTGPPPGQSAAAAAQITLRPTPSPAPSPVAPQATPVATGPSGETIAVAAPKPSPAPPPPTGITPKAQKTYLVAKIDEAIAQAAPRADLPDQAHEALAAHEGAGESIERTRGRMYAVPEKEYQPGMFTLPPIPPEVPTVTVEVPGDGTFTIINTKEALTAFKKAVAARFPVSRPAAPSAAKAPRPAPSALSRYIEGEEVEYATPHQFKPPPQPHQLIEEWQQVYAEPGYWGTGHFLIKAEAPATKMPPVRAPLPEGKTMAQFMAEVPLGPPARVAGIIKAARHQPAAMLEAKGQPPVFINPDYLNAVLAAHPEAVPHLPLAGAKVEAQPVVFLKGQERVGAVMGMNIQPTEKGVAGLIETLKAPPPEAVEPVGAPVGVGQAAIGEFAVGPGAKGPPPPPPGGTAAAGPSAAGRQALAMPELVEVAKDLLGGRVPSVKTHLRISRALGVFYPQRGIIQLAADIFKNPLQAAAVLAHEIGHVVDWLPDHYLARGNILGRIASLKKYMKHVLPEAPGAPGEALSEADRARLRREAVRIAEAAQRSEAEVAAKISVGKALITSEDILAIWRDVTGAVRASNQALYDYIARLSAPEKSSILKQALKGMVSPEVQARYQLAASEVQRPYVDWATRTKEIYEALVQEELKKRHLFDLAIIKHELWTLSRAWRPLPSRASSEHLAYRKSPQELYADAMSVLFNDPARLEREAPSFTKAFFAYLGKKPEVKALYKTIQARQAEGPAAVYAAREARIHAGYDAAEAIWAKSLNPPPTPLAVTIQTALVDRFSEILRTASGARRRGALPPAEDPTYAIERMRHTASYVEVMVRRNRRHVLAPMKKAGLTETHLSDYMFYRRVIEGDRSEIANPHGMTPADARVQMEGLKAALGEAKWQALVAVEQAFRREVMAPHVRFVKAGRVFSPEQVTLMETNPAYGTIAVVHWLEKSLGRITPYIMPQVGTLSEHAPMYTATVLKMVSQAYLVDTTVAKRLTAELLLREAPATIIPAVTRWNGRIRAPVPPPKGSGQGLLTYLEHGKLKGWYVPERLARAFGRDPLKEGDVGRILAALSRWQQPFRELFVNKNPAWIFSNILRDLETAMTQLPLPPGPIRWAPGLHYLPFLAEWGKALPVNLRDSFNIPQDVIEAVLQDRGMLSVTNRYGLDAEDTALERLLVEYGLRNPAAPQGWRKPLYVVWGWLDLLDKAGKAGERWTKTASFNYLTQYHPHLSDLERASLVRRLGGSPDFPRTAGADAITKAFFLYYNPNKEGMRSAWEAGFGGDRARVGGEGLGWYWYKKAETTIFFTLIKWFALLGAFEGIYGGSKWIMERVTEYDKSNYLIIPLGKVEDTDKAVYFRIPQDETSRLIGGVLWKTLQGTGVRDMQQLLDYTAGQVPTLNPLLGLLYDVGSYLRTGNTYDFFRGQPALPEQVAEARDARSHKAFAKWLWNQAGGRTIYAFRSEQPGEILAELEHYTGVPIVGGALGRFLKVTDRGLVETVERAGEPVRQRRAQEALDVTESFGKWVNQEPLTPAEAAQIAARPDLIEQKALAYLLRSKSQGALRAILSAKSIEERAARILAVQEAAGGPPPERTFGRAKSSP